MPLRFIIGVIVVRKLSPTFIAVENNSMQTQCHSSIKMVL
jgi:hypothetical protein